MIRGKKSLHISMEYEVHSDFRIQCFKKGLSMQEVLAEFARRVGQESNDVIRIMDQLVKDKQVKAVKKYESGIVRDPVTINSKQSIRELKQLTNELSISGMPVVDNGNLKGIVTGRSFCTQCKKKIPWYDNIPVISFVILNGKCRKCKNKISIQYLLVETLSAIGFFLIYSLHQIDEIDQLL